MSIRRRFDLLHRFFGTKTIAFVLLNVVCTFFIFGVEILVAFSLQATLVTMGVLSITAVKSVTWLSWLPTVDYHIVFAVLGALVICRGSLQWYVEYLAVRCTEGFLRHQKIRLFDWLFESSQINTGRFITLFTQRANNAAHVVRLSQIFLSNAIVAIFFLVGLIMMVPTVTLLLLCGLTFLLFPMRSIIRRAKRYGNQLTRQSHQNNRRIMMSIKNLLLIRTYGIEDREKKTVLTIVNKIFNLNLSYQILTSSVTQISNTLAMLLVCVIIFFFKSSGDATPGILIPYIYLLNRFLKSVVQLNNIISNFAFSFPQLLDLYRWWKEKSLDGEYGFCPYKPQLRTNLPAPKGPIGWKLYNATFHYPHADQYPLNSIITDLSMEITPGTCMGIVGPSGSGKSTLLSILLGQLVLQSGYIKTIIEGKEYYLHQTKHFLLNNIGYVGAESFLLEGTIYENMVYGLSHQPSSQELDRVIAEAECDFIRQFPKGLSHQLTEQGQGMSAGQKQRLCLARALLRRPKALILDEATANLDLASEAKLIATFSKLKGDITLLTATHRPAFAKIADHIMRFDVKDGIITTSLETAQLEQVVRVATA